MRTTWAFIPKPYFKVLKKHHFTRQYRTQAGDSRVIVYSNGEPHDKPRAIDIQFWNDGQFRVSHWHDQSSYEAPVHFQSPEEMEKAINEAGVCKVTREQAQQVRSTI